MHLFCGGATLIIHHSLCFGHRNVGMEYICYQIPEEVGITIIIIIIILIDRWYKLCPNTQPQPTTN